MLTGITHEKLLDCFLALEPLEISAIILHREYKTTGAMPSKESLGEAVRQLQEYGEQCRSLSHRAQQLPPVPALDSDLVKDFSL